MSRPVTMVFDAVRGKNDNRRPSKSDLSQFILSVPLLRTLPLVLVESNRMVTLLGKS